MKNRSVPVDTVLPHVMYLNVAEAIDWLTTTFGFSEHYRYGDPVGGAQMRFGNAYFMLKQSRGGSSPKELGYGTQMLTLFVNDVDTYYQHVKATGAKIVEELNESCYGERQFGVVDLDGHFWLFSQHARDLSPAEWGAQLAESKGAR